MIMAVIMNLLLSYLCYYVITINIMARPGISYHDVQMAIASLLERNIEPSVQSIRETLGTGSHTTITAHWRRWRSELNQVQQASLPPAVPEAVMAAVASFWQVAVDQAEAAYLERREQTRRDVETAEKTRDAALAEMTQARTQVAELSGELHEAHALNRSLSDELLVERERRLQADKAVAVAEQRVAEAILANETLRASAETRIAEWRAALERSQQAAETKVTEVRLRLQDECERAKRNEQQLLVIIQENRADGDRERQAIQQERLAWQDRERDFTWRLASVHQQFLEARTQLAGITEQNRSLGLDLEQSRGMLQERDLQYLETVRALENLRGEFKVTVDRCQVLEKELDNIRLAASQEVSQSALLGDKSGGTT